MCNLYKQQCHVKIPKGFYKCKSCKGYGVLLKTPQYKYKRVLAYICPICKGKGYMDWIQNIRDYNLEEELIKFIHKITSGGIYLNTYYHYVPFRCPNNKKCQIVKETVRKMNRKKKQERLERKYLCNPNC